MKCIIIDDDPVARRVLESYINQTDSLLYAESFETPVPAIRYLEQNPDIELIFLDIQLPGLDGFEFLDSLEHTPQVIVVSGSEEYALRSFEYGATDYLLKPITYGRFYRGVSKALRWSHPVTGEADIFLKKDSCLQRVSLKDILYIESMENYVSLHTETERFILHFTMKNMEGRMPPAIFRRVHRSYIVNMNRVKMIDTSSLTILRGKEEVLIPIGRSYREALMQSLRAFGKE